jgi:hypothetical protein
MDTLLICRIRTPGLTFSLKMCLLSTALYLFLVVDHKDVWGMLGTAINRIFNKGLQ